MNRSSAFPILIIGTLTGIALNMLVILAGNGVIISEYSAGYPFLLGLLALPALLVSACFGRFSIGWLLSGIAVAVLMLVFLFLTAFSFGLPGTEFVPSGMAAQVSALALLPCVVVVVRQPNAIRSLTTAICVSAILGWLGLQLTMRHLLEAEIATTLASSGCVFESLAGNRRIAKAGDVRIGIFLSAASERPIFVQDGKNYAWAYGQWGVATHRGVRQPLDNVEALSCGASAPQAF